jgi:hypothetical protein
VHLAWATLIMLTVPVIALGIGDPAGRRARKPVGALHR